VKNHSAKGVFQGAKRLQPGWAAAFFCFCSRPDASAENISFSPPARNKGVLSSCSATTAPTESMPYSTIQAELQSSIPPGITDKQSR
jgi:hypothetical protein